MSSCGILINIKMKFYSPDSSALNSHSPQTHSPFHRILFPIPFFVNHPFKTPLNKQIQYSFSNSLIHHAATFLRPLSLSISTASSLLLILLLRYNNNSIRIWRRMKSIINYTKQQQQQTTSRLNLKWQKPTSINNP